MKTGCLVRSLWLCPAPYQTTLLLKKKKKMHTSQTLGRYQVELRGQQSMVQIWKPLAIEILLSCAQNQTFTSTQNEALNTDDSIEEMRTEDEEFGFDAPFEFDDGDMAQRG
jgi:hypothetical protein